jgi:biotin carboxylase
MTHAGSPRNVLLLDSNVASLPIYRFLRRVADRVHVMGGNPADFLARFAPEAYVQLDYSRVDEVRAFMEREGITHVVPGCNDVSYLSSARLDDAGRFPGIDSEGVTETINNKEKFRAFAAGAALSVPAVHSPGSRITSPVIVKPVDAYSGRGVTVLKEPTPETLDAAVKTAVGFAKSGRCVVEDYVDGQLYSHSAFLAGGRILLDVVVEEHGSANQFAVDTSHLVTDFPAELLHRLRDEITGMAARLSLVDGLVHTQFIRSGSRFWIVEITRRCPGDLYSRLVELSTGVPYAEYYARPFLGMKIDHVETVSVKRLILRHTISRPSDGLPFVSLRFHESVEIEEYVPLALTGDALPRSPFGRVGLLFLRADSRQRLESLKAAALRRELYDIN